MAVALKNSAPADSDRSPRPPSTAPKQAPSNSSAARAATMHDDWIPEALADALGFVISQQRKEWTRERERQETESRAMLAEAQAKIAQSRDRHTKCCA